MAWVSWIGPWFTAAIAVVALIPVERWMHRHIQGLGYLITNNPQAAVLIYYLLLLPGVALHEGSQWLMAKVLRVPVKRFQLWPEKDPNTGKIRLGLVEIEHSVDTVRASLVGMIPVISGTLLIIVITSTFFDINSLLWALGTGDLAIMGQGIAQFTATPDFWLWVYIIFAVANAMLPEEHDHINWWLPLIVLGPIIAFLLVLDLGIIVQAGLEGPFAQLGRWLTLAFGMALGVDLGMMAIIAGLELLSSRVLKRDLEYI